MQTIINGLLIGILATAILDLWLLLLKHTTGIAQTNWAMVGRWIGHMPQGKFQHSAIADATVVPYELQLGWLTHYIVGVCYALLFLLGSELLALPVSLISALGFGLLTVVAPWLILQPGMGLGRFASRAPKPALTRTLNLIAHSVFGLGLYIAWQLL